MDINSIRMRNYKTLLLQFRNRADQADLPEHGLLTRFASHAGLNVRYLSHINNGRKNIGDEFARAMEKGFSLPHGWLDQNHGGSIESADESEREFAAAALRLYRESPVDAQAMLMRYMLERLESKKTTR